MSMIECCYKHEVHALLSLVRGNVTKIDEKFAVSSSSFPRRREPRRRESIVRKRKITKTTIDSRLRGNDVANSMMTLGYLFDYFKEG